MSSFKHLSMQLALLKTVNNEFMSVHLQKDHNRRIKRGYNYPNSDISNFFAKGHYVDRLK